MLNRIFAAVISTVALTQIAAAADLPARVPAKAAPYVVQTYNWTGFYVGLNAGYGWGRASDDVGSTNLDGFVGGGQIGYNWQAGNFVFGIETDFQGTGQSESASAVLPILGLTTAEAKIRYFGTVRGRLGVAWDRWLAYVTGGYAYTNIGVSISTALGSVSDNTTRSGYTLGLGAEYAFAGPWSIGLEYLFIDSGTQDVTLLGVTDSVRIRNNIVRAKLNYRF